MYSFEENIYKGHPILRLLRDGESVLDEAGFIIGPGFGIKKAKMIINTMAQIEIFFNSNGAKPPNDIEIYIDQGKYNIPCYCRKYINFKRGDTIIEKPYLKIWNNDKSIGFGLVKAEGLITLKNEIEDFIRKNDNRM
ncbi:MAG: hypothetical protein U9O59_06790 [Actinomycetota bacterium]|nr:hypothetical protein [Actinomycetota bacterium]